MDQINQLPQNMPAPPASLWIKLILIVLLLLYFLPFYIHQTYLLHDS